MGTYQVLSLRAKVDQEVMIMKEYSTFVTIVWFSIVSTTLVLFDQLVEPKQIQPIQVGVDLNGNERILDIRQISWTGTSPSNAVYWHTQNTHWGGSLTKPNKSGPGNNVNEMVLHIPQKLKISKQPTSWETIIMHDQRLICIICTNKWHANLNRKVPILHLGELWKSALGDNIFSVSTNLC